MKADTLRGEVLALPLVVKLPPARCSRPGPHCPQEDIPAWDAANAYEATSNADQATCQANFAARLATLRSWLTATPPGAAITAAQEPHQTTESLHLADRSAVFVGQRDAAQLPPPAGSEAKR